MGTEIVPAGSTVKIRVLMYDGSTAQTGLTVNVSVERISDGKFWDGAAWQAAYQALAMTELSGDAHKAGVYQYSFATPTAVGVFDWRVTYNGASFDRAFAGRISTDALSDLLDQWSDAMPELTGLISATPTIKQAMMLLLMHIRNNTTSGGIAPDEMLKIRNAAGTVIMKADEDYDGTTYMKAQLQAGP